MPVDLFLFRYNEQCRGCWIVEMVALYVTRLIFVFIQMKLEIFTVKNITELIETLYIWVLFVVLLTFHLYARHYCRNRIVNIY